MHCVYCNISHYVVWNVETELDPGAGKEGLRQPLIVQYIFNNNKLTKKQLSTHLGR